MGRIIEVTFILILVALLVGNADASAKIISAFASGYARVVEVLQARNLNAT